MKKRDKIKREREREGDDRREVIAVTVMKPEARKTSGRCLFGKKTLISRVDRGS